MKYGFVLSYGEPHQILEMAKAAEAAGWDGVFTWDGVSMGASSTYDPWAMMAALATVTESVTIGAMILPLARRRPWVVAKQAVTVDRLSNGRLVIPVALGVTDDRAFSGVNTDSPNRKDRAERLDECLEIIRLSESGDEFSYDGKHYQIDRMQLQPTPVQGHIPVWAVGAWPREKSMARPLKHDGMIVVDMSPGHDPFEQLSPEVVAETTAWIRDHRENVEAFDIVTEGKTESATDTDYVGRLREAGATWFIESRWDTETDTPESLMKRIQAGPPGA